MVKDDRLGSQLENAKLIKMYDEVPTFGECEHPEDTKINASLSELADRLKTYGTMKDAFDSFKREANLKRIIQEVYHTNEG